MSPKAWFAAAALLVISSTGISSMAQANVVAGRDYTTLRQPQRAQVSADKIEVIEFFNFACPGCYAMHRQILAWAAKLPKDVTFRRVAVSFEKPGWDIMARTFFALEATGDLDKVDTALFDAIHKERLPLFTQPAITAWMVKHGVDGAKFTSAFNSFGVNTRVAQNERTIVSYEIGAVPMVLIDGRYSPQGDTYERVFSNANELIARAKAERSIKKS
jgi:thiol:disulfide interchange protein DsbA